MDFFSTRKRRRRSSKLRIKAAKAEHANPFVFGEAFKNDIDTQRDTTHGLKRKCF
jgi:hypothetical protein